MTLCLFLDVVNIALLFQTFRGILLVKQELQPLIYPNKMICNTSQWSVHYIALTFYIILMNGSGKSDDEDNEGELYTFLGSFHHITMQNFISLFIHNKASLTIHDNLFSLAL